MKQFKFDHSGLFQTYFFTSRSQPGLPDGIILYQNYHFGFILEGLRNQIIDIFYGHLVHTVYGSFSEFHSNLIYILRSFGIFNPRFGTLLQEKSGNPARCIRPSRVFFSRLSS
jgi:hypothetical protein